MAKPKSESNCKDLQKTYKNILMLTNYKQKNGQGIFLQLIVLQNGSWIIAPFKGTIQALAKHWPNVALRTK